VLEIFSHIAPIATLKGGLNIGNAVLIGAGADILPNVSINGGCIVGAGLVVLNNMNPGVIYAGVPATCID